MPPVIINFIAAQSGTGKTTVLERLLPELIARGLKVAALKGEVHHYNLDIPGKDTWRFAQAGAAIVGMTTPEKYILIGGAPAGGGGTAAAAARLQECDLILVEGDKKGPHPKIEVVRSTVNRQPLLPAGIVAVVTDMADLPLPQGMPLFRLDDSNGLAGFICDHFLKPGGPEQELTHFDGAGRPRMVDVSDKESTLREAYAAGEIIMAPATLARIKAGTMKKGDVLAVAQVAAIMAVKETSRIIPMAHPLNISGADVDFNLDEAASKITIGVKVRLTGRTGVEMEALTGVSAAALTIYDMCKAIDKNMLIQNIRLLEKKGGRSGHYRRKEQNG